MRFCFALLLGLALAGLPACAREGPQELAGLWARGPGGCEAETGLRFDADAVRMVSGDASQVLLPQPAYTVRAEGEALRVTIRYALAPGLFGPRQAGEVVLRRQGDGWLEVAAHRTADGARGFARIRTPEADPLTRLMQTRRCGEGAWIEGLRGRPEQENAVGREPDGVGAGTEGAGQDRPAPAVGAYLRGRAAVLQDAS